jgi:hypothetical protein
MAARLVTLTVDGVDADGVYMYVNNTNGAVDTAVLMFGRKETYLGL